MTGVERTRPKHPSAAKRLSPETAKKISELKGAKAKLEGLIHKSGSLLWFVMNIGGYTLNDGLANDITNADKRSGGPSADEKSAILDLRVTVLALDRALSLLGYKRDKFIMAGVPEIQQAEYHWISERLTKFQKDRGLISKDSYDTRSLTGKRTIAEINKALSEKAAILQKK